MLFLKLKLSKKRSAAMSGYLHFFKFHMGLLSSLQFITTEKTQKIKRAKSAQKLAGLEFFHNVLNAKRLPIPMATCSADSAEFERKETTAQEKKAKRVHERGSLADNFRFLAIICSIF